jgi:hypothetical protein
MNHRSTRLQRVLRKFALDRRLALQTQARAETQRRALLKTEERIVTARNTLKAGNGTLSVGDLAALTEWRERLEIAQSSLQPAIERSQADFDTAANAATLAKGKEETLERIRNEAVLSETKAKEQRFNDNYRLRSRRKGSAK